MVDDSVIPAIELRIERATARYGDFTSTHEALGVALEEWNELMQAVHSNSLGSVYVECLDLAAVLVKFARELRNPKETNQKSLKDRSVK